MPYAPLTGPLLPHVDLVPATIGLAIAVYLLPGLIALQRNRARLRPVIIANLLLGWTVLGWLACLHAALHDRDRHGNRGQPTAP
jgi:hypothetical protein